LAGTAISRILALLSAFSWRSMPDEVSKIQPRPIASGKSRWDIIDQATTIALNLFND
jgi:hypothetical protein